MLHIDDERIGIKWCICNDFSVATAMAKNSLKPNIEKKALKISNFDFNYFVLGLTWLRN